jgi:hypothetical protein
MKVALVVLFVVSAAWAQDKPMATAVAPGCGAIDVKFDVKADKAQHPITQAEGGKAVVYFVEDDTHFQSTPKPTTRIGLDGTWVGANHGNSYFYFTVEPGEHHLCASWQSTVGIGSRNKSAAAHFTAEAGGVYYFSVKNSWLRDSMILGIELVPLDSDEGQLLASKFSYSTFHPKD